MHAQYTFVFMQKAVDGLYFTKPLGAEHVPVLKYITLLIIGTKHCGGKKAVILRVDDFSLVQLFPVPYL